MATNFYMKKSQLLEPTGAMCGSTWEIIRCT